MQTVSVWNLVVGDIIQMHPGDKVPADCLVLSSANLHVREVKQNVELNDDAPTEFEWTELRKDNTASPFLFADSFVLAGTCKAVVCCVGQNSTRGIEDTVYNTREEDTELTEKLVNIETSLKFMALIGAIVIGITSMVVLFM